MPGCLSGLTGMLVLRENHWASGWFGVSEESAIPVGSWLGGKMSCTRRHVVVTGASSGIGRTTALRLAHAGWHVYAGVPRADDGESLQAASSGGQVSPLLMDVTVVDQIDAAVEVVGEHVGTAGLDGLVDNAGIGVARPVELVPLDALRRQRGPLAASKAAIATLADALRQEVAPWGIRVVLVEPASINSGAADKLERDATRAVSEFGANGVELYRDSYLGMVKAALARERRGSPPTVVADLVLKILTTARPRARNVVAKDARMLATVSRWLPTSALDAMRRKVFSLPKPGSLTTPTST
jgi:NAD(P)-dependent dehydrogenase (short-subunit alcohol dehydrogenase family)